MRPMRRAAPLLLVGLVACGRPADEPRTFSAPEVPESLELAGLRVEEAPEGPWRTRRTVRPDASPGADEAPRESKGGSGGPDATAALPARSFAGSDAAPGSREPSDPTPAPPPAAEAVPAAEAPPVTEGMPLTLPPRTPSLRAGSTDDNADYPKFLEFLGTWTDREGIADAWDPLDVRERRWLKVVNRKGEPVPAARVSLVDEVKDAQVWAATTYGDGRAPFFPSVAGGGAFGAPVPSAPEGGWLVEARRGEARATARWDGRSAELVLELDEPRPVEEPVRLDVLILLDTTGSMGDEIDRVKATLLKVTQRVRSIEREFDLRYGAVLYRDVGDEYVTKAHPFTKDLAAFDEALRTVTAGGGGDTPESVNQGLAEAVGRMDWREGAAKVAFLIADAAPHMDYAGDVRYGTTLRAALAKGIRIHSVAASGLDEFGSLVFRQIAQFTRGKFVFIEYGTPAADAAGHGVSGEVKSNNLDDILYEQIGEELARWGRPT